MSIDIKTGDHLKQGMSVPLAEIEFLTDNIPREVLLLIEEGKNATAEMMFAGGGNEEISQALTLDIPSLDATSALK